MPHFNPQSCANTCCIAVNFYADDCNLYWEITGPPGAFDVIYIEYYIGEFEGNEIWNAYYITTELISELRSVPQNRYRLSARELTTGFTYTAEVDFTPQEDCCGIDQESVRCSTLLGKNFQTDFPDTEQNTMYLNITGFPFQNGWLNGSYRLKNRNIFQVGNYTTFFGTQAILGPRNMPGGPFPPSNDGLAFFEKLSGPGAPSWANTDFGGPATVDGCFYIQYNENNPDASPFTTSCGRVYSPHPLDFPACYSEVFDFGSYGYESIAVRILSLRGYIGFFSTFAPSNYPNILRRRCNVYARLSIEYEMFTKGHAPSIFGGRVPFLLRSSAIHTDNFYWNPASWRRNAVTVLGETDLGLGLPEEIRPVAFYKELPCEQTVNLDLSDLQSKIVNSFNYQWFSQNCVQAPP